MPITVGSITIDPVYEQPLDAVAVVVPDAQAAALKQIPWLAPPFIDAEGNPQGVIQAFVVRTGDKIVLIDPAVGDDKDISVVPEWNHNTTGFLERLADAGVQPEDVDIVVSTHLHLDHVGWATRLTENGWKPTFPNARYLFMGVEFRHWEAESKQTVVRLGADEPEVEHVLALFRETQISTFEQSVRPVQEAGLIDLIDEYGEIAPGVTLVSTPGHTPAHTSVSIRSGDDHLFLTGDAFHHPGQIAHPEWAALSDVDGEQSTATRRRILAEFVDTPTIVLGNHFAQPSMGRIVSDGSGGYIFDSTGLEA